MINDHCLPLANPLANTVGARILKIQIPNPFKNRTFSCSVLGCSAFEWSIQKENFQNSRSKLDRFIYKEKSVYTQNGLG